MKTVNCIKYIKRKTLGLVMLAMLLLAASSHAQLGTYNFPNPSVFPTAPDVTFSSFQRTNLGTLGGVAPNVGNLTFEGGATLDALDPITATGLDAAALVGTATIVPDLDLGGSDTTVTVGTGGTLELQGDLTLGGRLAKLGDGVLDMDGDNFGLGSVRIGLTDGTHGGTVRIASATALGGDTLQFNHGTLEAKQTLTGVDAITNAVSFGGYDGTPATFTGSDMEFTGAVSFWETSGQANRIDVENTTTFSGSMAMSGSFGATGLIVGGGGTLVVAGDAAGMAMGATVTDTATLMINNIWGSSVLVEADATLSGDGGTVQGFVGVFGTHDLRSGPQTFQNGVSYEDGSFLNWELDANSEINPNFADLTGGDLTFDGEVVLSLHFNGGDSTVNWLDSFWNSDHLWTIAGVDAGSITGLENLDIDSTWMDAFGNNLMAVRPGVSFGLMEDENGDLILSYSAIPEPASWMLVAVGGALIFAARRRMVRRV